MLFNIEMSVYSGALNKQVRQINRTFFAAQNEKNKRFHNCESCCDLVCFLLHARHYKLSVAILCFLVPTLVPWYFWGESLAVGYFVAGLLRYTLILNATWLVNSAAHMWGNRPYDKTINPRENPLVALTAIGKESERPFIS